MLKNNRGVTLMSLVITIVVMLIMISVIGYYSVESIKNGHISNQKKELADVVEYVSYQKAKLIIDEFDVYESGEISPVISTEGLYLLASGLDANDLNKIIEVNSYEYLEDNYKYVYLTATDFNEKLLSEENIVVKDVKNDYIVNFYTGTVIALYDQGKRVEISGMIKGLNEIMVEIY